MRILVDECAPRLIKRLLPDHQVLTIHDAGWTGVRNGELLRRAEGLFDVLITADKNLRHQQNMSGRKLAAVVLPSNRIPVVARIGDELAAALARIRPGEVIELAMPA